MRKIQFDEQTISFLLTFDPGIYIFEKQKNQLKIILEVPIVLKGIAPDKSVSMSVYRKQMMKTVRNVCNEKRAETIRTFLSRTKSQYLCCLVVMAHIGLSNRRVVTTEMKNDLVF